MEEITLIDLSRFTTAGTTLHVSLSDSDSILPVRGFGSTHNAVPGVAGPMYQSPGSAG
jgi:hypothetical protein